MPSIIAYRKFITHEITQELRLPLDTNGNSLGVELATLDNGITYVSLPDGAALPVDQHAEIIESVQTVILTGAQIEAIKSSSPYVRFINYHVSGQLDGGYGLTPEIEMLRTMPDEYIDHASACRAWGEAELAKVGL